MQFDYFYGNEAEQFTFYRIPKVLIKSPQFKQVSPSRKNRQKKEAKNGMNRSIS